MRCGAPEAQGPDAPGDLPAARESAPSGPSL